ncbi:MAG: methyltransferase domain-containing protein [Actinobacteria bacterium]|nr:MAG: methyltransferase domain-containing protein [Actinomycetota bacterium]
MLHWHESYFDAWPVGVVAEALIGAGLQLERLEELPDLDGRHVLHLTCGQGRETAALIGLGALVTGVDGSEETVRAARKRLPDAALVTADVSALPVELRR